MLDIFLKDNGHFVNYGTEHFIAFTSCILLIAAVLYAGKRYWTTEQQYRYIIIITIIGAASQLFKVLYKWNTGIFHAYEDYPLHLCNIMSLLMPFIYIFRMRILWGITFFWIMGGCAQSIFTPTLTESMPHYEATRYWLVHAVIILGALYGNIVSGWKITWKDAVRSILGLNLLAAIIYPINVMLKANYMYLNAKPPGTTFYDLLGPWPEYMVALEFIVITLFFAMTIPFYWRDIKAYLVEKKLL